MRKKLQNLSWGTWHGCNWWVDSKTFWVLQILPHREKNETLYLQLLPAAYLSCSCWLPRFLCQWLFWKIEIVIFELVPRICAARHTEDKDTLLENFWFPSAIFPLSNKQLDWSLQENHLEIWMAGFRRKVQVDIKTFHQTKYCSIFIPNGVLLPFKLKHLLFWCTELPGGFANREISSFLLVELIQREPI